MKRPCCWAAMMSISKCFCFVLLFIHKKNDLIFSNEVIIWLVFYLDNFYLNFYHNYYYIDAISCKKNIVELFINRKTNMKSNQEKNIQTRKKKIVHSFKLFIIYFYFLLNIKFVYVHAFMQYLLTEEYKCWSFRKKK